MTDKEKIRVEIKRLLNEKWRSSIQTVIRQDIYRGLLEFIDSLPEEPASEDLQEAAREYATSQKPSDGFTHELLKCNFIDGAQWQKQNLWKDAQGDDLPEIGREVIALQGIKIVFAHRPNPEGFNGKSLSTGETEHYTPRTYDKGGWNMPDVKYWLDVELPEGIE